MYYLLIHEGLIIHTADGDWQKMRDGLHASRICCVNTRRYD